MHAFVIWTYVIRVWTCIHTCTIQGPTEGEKKYTSSHMCMDLCHTRMDQAHTCTIRGLAEGKKKHAYAQTHMGLAWVRTMLAYAYLVGEEARPYAYGLWQYAYWGPICWRPKSTIYLTGKWEFTRVDDFRRQKHVLKAGELIYSRWIHIFWSFLQLKFN